MNRQDIIRIRLKVITTTGINILCTALKNQKVSEWLPHFEEAYREVKQEQGDDQPSKQRFIKTIRIKKGDFYVANSEVIGDVFEDNDEVICEMLFPNSKKQNKANKRESKAEKKIQPNKPNKKRQLSSSEEDQEVQDLQIPKKIVKEDRHIQQQEILNKTISSIHEIVKGLNITNSNATPSKQKKKQNQQATPSDIKKNEFLQKVDLLKLKNLIVKPNSASKTTTGSKVNQQKSRIQETNPIELQQQ